MLEMTAAAVLLALCGFLFAWLPAQDRREFRSVLRGMGRGVLWSLAILPLLAWYFWRAAQ